MTAGPKISAALVKAQAELRAIPKDALNPHFKNRYSTLEAMLEVVRPVLAKHGLGVTQSASPELDGRALTIHSLLLHESGETLMSDAFIPLGKLDAQGAGGAMTYGRRYGLAALLCLTSDDDDDGVTASRPARRERVPREGMERLKDVVDQSQAATAARAAGQPPPMYNWAGAPGDRPMPWGDSKGKPLSEFSTEKLTALKQWCQGKQIEEGHQRFKPIIKDIVSVIADRALGRDDDSAVERMKASVAADEDELPF